MELYATNAVLMPYYSILARFSEYSTALSGGKTDESIIQDLEYACSSVFLKDFELVRLSVVWFDLIMAYL